MSDEIENLGKGAIPDSPDPRDFRAEVVFGAPDVDWNNPINGQRYKKIKYWRNQRSSLSCTGQATAYAVDIITQYPLDAKSARSIYSYIYSGGGGAAIRDAVLRAIDPGVATQSQAPDPQGLQATETNYRKNSDITLAELESGKQFKAFLLPNKSIDWVAWGIQNYDAVVWGLAGRNVDWQNKVYPKFPPLGIIPDWHHAIAGVDFHICTDGKKCIINTSSWVNQAGDVELKVHHIKEDYFLSGFTFNPWAIIPRGDVRMLVFFKKVGDQTVWALLDGEWVGFSDMPAWTAYINGRPHEVIELSATEFAKLKANPGVFKT